MTHPEHVRCTWCRGTGQTEPTAPADDAADVIADAVAR